MVKALLLSAFLIAQASAQEFEVASVKPAPPGTEYMRQLIVWATEQSDRPIIDRTGLTGNYDFAMPWEPQGVRVAEETGVTAPADVASINSALERYLGLLLVPRKEPVEMLVIDRLERVPTEN